MAGSKRAAMLQMDEFDGDFKWRYPADISLVPTRHPLHVARRRALIKRCPRASVDSIPDSQPVFCTRDAPRCTAVRTREVHAIATLAIASLAQNCTDVTMSSCRSSSRSHVRCDQSAEHNLPLVRCLPHCRHPRQRTSACRPHGRHAAARGTSHNTRSLSGTRERAGRCA